MSASVDVRVCRVRILPCSRSLNAAASGLVRLCWWVLPRRWNREQAVRENPPIMLKCGHVICRNSMTRILKGGNRLKCPTCPVEQYADETRELKL